MSLIAVPKSVEQEIKRIKFILCKRVEKVNNMGPAMLISILID